MVMICVAECTAVNKESKAKGFQSLRVGDIMRFTVPLHSVGRSPGGRSTYATYIDCKNMRTGEEGFHSFNQIEKYLNCYDFKQIYSI